MPLEVIASRYHVVDVLNLGDRYHVGLADGIVPMDRDLELTWKPEPASASRATVFTESVDGEQYLLLMMLPPTGSATGLSMPRELIFVIDTSGSMHGSSLQQAKRALAEALAGLQPQDLFNVIEFNSETQSLFRSSVAADPNSIAIAQTYVAGLAANGGTEMSAAIHRALSGGAQPSHLRQVIFVTDGSVGNEAALFEQISRELGDSRLFTVGIGSAPNGWFMRKAAEAGRGSSTTISALHEVGEKMQRLFRKLEQPQVTNVDIQWPSGVVVDSYPARIPDLYAGEPVLVTAKLNPAARAGDLVVVSGDSVYGSWRAELPVAIGKKRSGVGALWARSRIEALLTRLRQGEDEAVIRPAVVETALAHHIVSRFTSLVAVDKTPANPGGGLQRRDFVPGLKPGEQAAVAVSAFAATATDAELRMLTGLAMILLALAMLLSSRRRSRVRAWPGL